MSPDFIAPGGSESVNPERPEKERQPRPQPTSGICQLEESPLQTAQLPQPNALTTVTGTIQIYSIHLSHGKILEYTDADFVDPSVLPQLISSPEVFFNIWDDESPC
jgi:hypothetical protein